ncbi:MAG TPA: PD-(D/E)XK motif protein [Kiritimatiellia bacterium]|nr:PD-(D/E)XK motif protein [Kiritimatiellia bacterium]HMO99746.1 PD-(D/E)XK motif protein [Kiritimatiellia bacterium]HMP00017.1 PD-(D/E)XK motif protein [Kiritimatiellia bacterium]HMP97315.1 PD-(D/E)XK motif protein [Kiritimatiellia bacterium]
MNSIAPEVWAKLTAAAPSGESLTARFASPTVTERLLAAIDANGRRHFLIPLKAGDEGLHDAQSRGITVATRDLSVRDRETGSYLDFVCQDGAGHEAFDLIGGELADGLRSVSAKPAVMAARVLAKWRRFWGHTPWQVLSREEQLGLFAELWFLSAWLIPRIGVGKAMEGWRGPLGSRHDFEWPGKSIEVKATTSTRGRIHHINGIDQLAPPENGDLLFYSMRLREEGGATTTLPGLIAFCRMQMESDADVMTRFESALVQAGYSPAHDDEYSKTKLRVVDEVLFRVAEDFPRLFVKSFGGLPSGVEQIEYLINLSGFEHMCVAVKPDEFVFE